MKEVIGRKEKITLSEWGFSMISAKVDTGAYTSAIHCEYAKVKMVGGKRILEFVLLSPSHKHFKNQILSTQHFLQKKVKNSFGHVETRYKVSTKVTMFGKDFEGEFTLSNRSKMKNPILLGRKMLKGRFLIDVDYVNLASSYKKAKK
ncbi:MAG: RimK/LysX family protein [Anditalea sp.]